jgi:hypothetical protein
VVAVDAQPHQARGPLLLQVLQGGHHQRDAVGEVQVEVPASGLGRPALLKLNRLSGLRYCGLPP